MPSLNINPNAPRSGPEIQVKRLKAREELHVTMVSSSVWGVYTHWNASAGAKGRSEPCYIPQEDCPGCRACRPHRWKGYLHVLMRDEGVKQFFLEMTPAAVESLTTMFPNGLSMRGQRAMICRMNGDKARLRVTLLPSGMVDLGKLPPELDPKETLEKLWGWPAPSGRGGRVPDTIEFNRKSG